jgi:hypothetical protein
MSFKMVVDSDIIDLSVSARFFAYARSYLNASKALCQQMETDEHACTWPNAAVVLMLSAHAVELALKGAIYHRSPSTNVETHQIEKLAAMYSQLFPEPSFAWDVPFKVDYSGLTEAEVGALRKQVSAPSILYRYPVNRSGKEWNGAFGFAPTMFLPVLEQIQNDFGRIEPQLT